LAASAVSVRPLAIVVDTSKPIDEECLADVAFAVGARIVRVGRGETPDATEQRIPGALEASMRLRRPRERSSSV
jgi:hypothetical protein